MDRRIGKQLKVFSISLLLFLYVAGNVQVETFHQFFHSLEKVLHSSEQEKDPCHRAIYHAGKSGCAHKTHVTEVKKCPLCHLVPFNTQHVASTQSVRLIPTKIFFDFISCPEPTIEAAYNLPSRAPPIS